MRLDILGTHRIYIARTSCFCKLAQNVDDKIYCWPY